jgi:ribosomal protein S18 acetylase RimI-like enzyme
MNVTIGPMDTEHLPAVAGAVARWQSDPRTHVCYLSMDADAIASELTELEPAGLDAGLVALRDGQVVGCLSAEWDTDPPRVWWYGPFVDPADPEADDIVDVLYERMRFSLPRSVVEEELAVDDRHVTVAAFAARHGFERVDDASAVFVLQTATASVDRGVGVDVMEIEDADRSAVAALHDRLFPGTHSTGGRIASGEHHQVLLVAHSADRPVGYLAGEVQTDGEGYIDYLGVEPDHRGQGIGKALVLAAVGALRGLGCHRISLTVRESNHAARRLYRSLGFTEERLLRPWRKGFGL